ncbi:MAG: dipeptide epimerase [Cyclobacteriaceae bacterium]|nr:dipeptide epimerase [Cyclobacteriaceae bacterium]
MTKIKNIEVHRVDLQLTRPYTIAFKTVDHVENAVVKLILDNGIVGWGAGNPSEQVVGESLDQALKALGIACNLPVHKDPWQRLLGRDIHDLAILCKEIQAHLPKNPAARTALEIALHDAYCQCLKIPLVQYLGQKIESMPTSVTIGIKGVTETLAEADEYLALGFRILKVKLGNDLEEDIERMVRLREQVGEHILIRVDANQGYEVAGLHRFYQETKNCRLELIEQPLPVADLEGLRGLPSDIKALIAADESLIGPGHARLLAKSPGACGIFNIKLMKCGGITKALDIAEVAEKSGIHLMWGCNDESIISIAAALHTAFACARTRYIDLDGSFDLARDVVSGGFDLKDGVMSIKTGFGLGVLETGLV